MTMWEEITPSGAVVAYPEEPVLYTRGLSSRMYNPKDKVLVGYWREDRRYAVVQSCGQFTNPHEVIGELRRLDHEFKSLRQYSILYKAGAGVKVKPSIPRRINRV